MCSPHCTVKTKEIKMSPSYLNEVGHGEVHDVVFPGELQDDIRMEEVVTLEQTRREAVVCLVVQEVAQQVLKRVWVKSGHW